jgi:hypothetical protein
VNLMSDGSKIIGLTTEPEIFITVQRWVNGHQVLAQRKVSFEIWRTGKFTDRFFDSEVNAMMKEVHHG